MGGGKVHHKSCNRPGWAAVPSKNCTTFYPKAVQTRFLPKFFITMFYRNFFYTVGSLVAGAPVSHGVGPVVVRDNSAQARHHMCPTLLSLPSLGIPPPWHLAPCVMSPMRKFPTLSSNLPRILITQWKGIARKLWLHLPNMYMPRSSNIYNIIH